jgi:hypothetical protein
MISQEKFLPQNGISALTTVESLERIFSLVKEQESKKRKQLWEGGMNTAKRSGLWRRWRSCTGKCRHWRRASQAYGDQGRRKVEVAYSL